MDEQQRGRIRDDLKGFLKGDLLFDDLSRALYSTDASIFQVTPLGVVAPRDEEDVQALVRYAAENKFALVPRGAGTGLAGESLGAGLVLDLSKYFRDILGVGVDTVRVQPGVRLAALNERLAKEGRRFAPDPASAAVCTVGGMLANNASGARSLRYGYTRDYVDSLSVVLDSGETAVARREIFPFLPDFGPAHWHNIASGIALLLEQNAGLVRQCQPETRFNRCGYLVEDVRTDGHIDLCKLLVGSEGTLCLFTEATLRTVPLPEGRALVLLGFASLDAALHAAQNISDNGVVACELLDRRLLSMVRGKDAANVIAGAEALLLIEFEADSPAAARRQAADLAHRLGPPHGTALTVVLGTDLDHFDQLWQLREAALPSLYGVKGGAQPVPFVEDVGVPLQRLPDFLRRAQEIMQENDTTASFLIHACTGQVHTRPFLDLGNPEEYAKLTAIAEEIHALVLELKGTISTQHGIGLARTPWVARQYGPLYAVFRQIKAVFDPHGLFNPGKIVDPDPGQPPWPPRLFAKTPPGEWKWELHWRDEEACVETNHCNGCGECRTEQPEQRMCPLFRATGAEAGTPRAKANLLRHVLSESAAGKQLGAAEVRDVADLCFNCKMCAYECPARVNIPKLMLEAKAANVRQFGLERSDAFFARLESYIRWGATVPWLTNFFLGSRVFRWLFDKFWSLSPRRKLPRFVRRSFLKRARRRGWCVRPKGSPLTPDANSPQGNGEHPKGERPWVVYFPDLFATYFDPQIGEAVVLVLQHHGYDVFVPAEQRGSGIEALAMGDVDSARDSAQRNLRALADLAREGATIVCSEPSAAVMLRQDYPNLVSDLDARLVAERTVEFTTFLGNLKRQGKFRTDFQPVELAVGHHIPCHLKALGEPIEGPSLLGLIPGCRVQVLDVSCSGMAGTYGLKRDNYETSLAVGRPMLTELRQSSAPYGASECSSCRMQMEAGAGKRSLHPAQYLALAYGLLPDVSKRLQEPIRDLLLR
ncbi:MAG: FAD-binding protein [Gemmataceae bacterium]|nr:FAD-binding protein [Gemmataceae bacterium]MCI0741089.1 FAD-binding protein [Gemmataceae bacterium]